MSVDNAIHKEECFPPVAIGGLRKICRLCLQSSKNLESLAATPFLETFRQISSLELKMEGKFPKKVCAACVNEMKKAAEVVKFIKKCKQSQYELNNYIELMSVDSGTINPDIMPSPDIENTIKVVPGSVIDGKIMKRLNFKNTTMVDPKVLKNYSQKIKKSNRRIVLVPLNAIKHASPEQINEIVKKQNDKDVEKLLKNERVFSQTTAHFLQNPVQEVIVETTPNEDIATPNEVTDQPEQLETSKIVTSWSKLKSKVIKAKDENGKVKSFKVVNKHLTPTLISLSKRKMSTRRRIKPKTELEGPKIKRKQMCESCGLLTTQLAKHKNQNKSCAYQCENCDYVTIHKRFLIGHMKEVHDESLRKREPRQRMKTNNSSTRFYVPNKDGNYSLSYKCASCGSTVADIRKHRFENKSCWYKCELCDYTNYNQYKVKTHRSVVHMGMRYMCNICDRSFTTTYTLHRHKNLHSEINTKKSQEGPLYSCDFCHKQFKNQSAHQFHTGLHTKEKPYQCNKCPKSFGFRAEMKKHMEEEHNEVVTKTCLCDVCGKAFKDISNLRNHVKAHSEDLFKCDQCPYKTPLAALIKAHRWVHTNERPFACKICGKSFRQTKQLLEHTHLHTNVKRFSCKYCGKKFVYKNNCMEHQMKHTGVQPFPCYLCDKKFYNSWWRDKHIAAVHDKEFETKVDAKPIIQSVISFKLEDEEYPFDLDLF